MSPPILPSPTPCTNQPPQAWAGHRSGKPGVGSLSHLPQVPFPSTPVLPGCLLPKTEPPSHRHRDGQEGAAGSVAIKLEFTGNLSPGF